MAGKKRLPELLAPAGTPEALKAAVENGADAVYLGSGTFNARMKAKNFHGKDLEEAVAYARLRNVSVYVTMNTLIREEEMEEAAACAGFLREAGASGLIVQDPGLGAMLRRAFPDLPLHLSTQGTVYNVTGAKMAAAQGYSRVVLARELLPEEIREICREASVETEVFIHGALCMAYSGQCHLSRAAGGRSGNRGLCAQPCRLEYRGEEAGEKAFRLSPRDLCTVDHLGELIQTGVSSLKIEGRLKSPEYVAVVAGIYRKYLDLAGSGQAYTVSEADRRALLQIFNRGGFFDSWEYDRKSPCFLSGELPKHRGIPIGIVTGKGNRKNLIEISLYKGETLSLGDGIELGNPERTGNVVTFLRPAPGGRWIAGDLKGKARTGDPVFRVTEKAQWEAARQSYQTAGSAGRKRRTAPVEMVFRARAGRPALLTVFEQEKIAGAPAAILPELKSGCRRKPECGKTVKRRDALPERSKKTAGRGTRIRSAVRVESSAPLEMAVKAPLTEETARRQLEKTGESPFGAAGIRTSLDGRAAMALSELNRMRREALERLEAMKKRNIRRPPAREPEARTGPGPLRALEEETERGLELFFYRTSDWERWKPAAEKAAGKCRIRVLMPLEEWDPQWETEIEALEKAGCQAVPYLFPVTRGKLDRWLLKNSDRISEVCLRTGIYIGNWGWIREFLDMGAAVYPDFGLNLCNREAFAWAAETGMDLRWAVPSLEVCDGAPFFGAACFGALPLMITETAFCGTLHSPRQSFKLEGAGFPGREQSVIVKKTDSRETAAFLEGIESRLGGNTRRIRYFIPPGSPGQKAD